MIYALDTNIISYLMRHYGNVRKRYFDAITDGNRCIIPLVVYYEVMRGLEASGATVQVREFGIMCAELGVDDLTVSDMNVAARIYSERKKRGEPMEDTDLLIAAQASTRGYILVTHNTRHFEHIDGLTLEDWAE
jgi:tRNA(fMet)-specific endonuclease VapC